MRQMNRLALNRGYLCGAMDRVLDGGVAWRQDLKTSLKDLKILWLDPTRKPIDIGVEDLENRALRQAAKRAGDFEFIRNQMKQIRPVDLRMVDICDFLIINIDLDVHACGTYEELYWGNRMKKPCVVRIAQGIEHTPDWLLGTLPFRDDLYDVGPGKSLSAAHRPRPCDRPPQPLVLFQLDGRELRQVYRSQQAGKAGRQREEETMKPDTSTSERSIVKGLSFEVISNLVWLGTGLHCVRQLRRLPRIHRNLLCREAVPILRTRTHLASNSLGKTVVEPVRVAARVSVAGGRG